MGSEGEVKGGGGVLGCWGGDWWDGGGVRLGN